MNPIAYLKSDHGLRQFPDCPFSTVHFATFAREIAKHLTPVEQQYWLSGKRLQYLLIDLGYKVGYLQTKKSCHQFVIAGLGGPLSTSHSREIVYDEEIGCLCIRDLNTNEQRANKRMVVNQAGTGSGQSEDSV